MQRFGVCIGESGGRRTLLVIILDVCGARGTVKISNLVVAFGTFPRFRAGDRHVYVHVHPRTHHGVSRYIFRV